MKVLPDLISLGLDCICPFERPPGGDVTALKAVASAIDGRVTFNGNIHTVATLIRGTPADVRREVLEILEVFDGSHRLIIGTGDQVGWETPDENIYSMIDTVRQYGKRG
jgi:uroporphyrinogen-III decarboxylase